MKTTNTLFKVNEIRKTVTFAFLIIYMAFYGHTVKAGNRDPKINNLIVQESPPSKPELILVPYEYSNGYNVSCTGFSDGSIDLTVTGGVPPYSYKWSNEEVTEDIYNLAIGYYKVTVVDAANQVVWAEITLTGPNPDSEPKISYTVSSYPNGYNVSCYSCFNGSIDLSVTGGTGVYTYKWDKDNVTTQDRAGLGGGNYGVTISDASACGNNKEYHINVELTQPERKDLWTMNGNANTNPGTQFIGTTDNKEMIFKTNDTEQMRINANGNVGIGMTNPMAKLSIEGNMFLDGKITTNRITSIDSLLYIGDSSITYNSNWNRLSADGIGTIKGMGLGDLTFGKGIYSTAIGYCARAYGNNSICIGNLLSTNTSSYKSIIIGSAPSDNSSLFTNEISNSLMVGFNSTIPTLFVGTSNGAGTTGNIGISTKAPTDKLQIGDGEESVSFGSVRCEEGGYMIGYQAFNARRIRTGQWTTSTWNMAANTGGAVIAVDATGSIEFIPLRSNIPTPISDIDIKNLKVVTIGAGTYNGSQLNDAYMKVNGKIWTKEVEVTLTGVWPDFVFEKKYDLLPLSDIEKYITKHKHLPDMPTADEVAKNGLALGETQALLLKKIEELTLYVIELNKQVELLKKENEYLKKSILNK